MAVRTLRGDAERTRRQLIQSYFCLLAVRHYVDEISARSHDRHFGGLANNILDSKKALGLIVAGGLRTAISEYEIPVEFRALTVMRGSY